jgi:DNA ligase D-like protein (predicted 3'-phosphoesterase)
MADPLDTYRSMRRFDRTPEPAGRVAPKGGEFPIYCIQQHDATRLHFDFRLEVAGVMKSWAVTKVPTLDPDVKRLAVRTEDHPRDYAEFEGVIPEGDYGAGPVIVWDYGVFLNQTTKQGTAVPIEQAIDHGHVVVWLQGVKLRGGFALSRFKEEAGKEQWLFMKVRDTEAKHGEPTWENTSALTGRTLDDVIAGRRKSRRDARHAPPPRKQASP